MQFLVVGVLGPRLVVDKTSMGDLCLVPKRKLSQVKFVLLEFVFKSLMHLPFFANLGGLSNLGSH